MSDKQTDSLFKIEDIYMLSGALSGLIMIFYLAIDQETDLRTSQAFRIVSDKSFELAQQCEELFKRYQEYARSLKENDRYINQGDATIAP